MPSKRGVFRRSSRGHITATDGGGGDVGTVDVDVDVDNSNTSDAKLTKRKTSKWLSGLSPSKRRQQKPSDNDIAERKDAKDPQNQAEQNPHGPDAVVAVASASKQDGEPRAGERCAESGNSKLDGTHTPTSQDSSPIAPVNVINLTPFEYSSNDEGPHWTAAAQTMHCLPNSPSTCDGIVFEDRTDESLSRSSRRFTNHISDSDDSPNRDKFGDLQHRQQQQQQQDLNLPDFQSQDRDRTTVQEVATEERDTCVHGNIGAGFASFLHISPSPSKPQDRTAAQTSPTIRMATSTTMTADTSTVELADGEILLIEPSPTKATGDSKNNNSNSYAAGDVGKKLLLNENHTIHVDLVAKDEQEDVQGNSRECRTDDNTSDDDGFGGVSVVTDDGVVLPEDNSNIRTVNVSTDGAEYNARSNPKGNFLALPHKAALGSPVLGSDRTHENSFADASKDTGTDPQPLHPRPAVPRAIDQSRNRAPEGTSNGNNDGDAHPSGENGATADRPTLLKTTTTTERRASNNHQNETSSERQQYSLDPLSQTAGNIRDARLYKIPTEIITIIDHPDGEDKQKTPKSKGASDKAKEVAKSTRNADLKAFPSQHSRGSSNNSTQDNLAEELQKRLHHADMLIQAYREKLEQSENAVGSLNKDMQLARKSIHHIARRNKSLHKRWKRSLQSLQKSKLQTRSADTRAARNERKRLGRAFVVIAPVFLIVGGFVYVAIAACLVFALLQADSIFYPPELSSSSSSSSSPLRQDLLSFFFSTPTVQPESPSNESKGNVSASASPMSAENIGKDKARDAGNYGRVKSQKGSSGEDTDGASNENENEDDAAEEHYDCDDISADVNDMNDSTIGKQVLQLFRDDAIQPNEAAGILKSSTFANGDGRSEIKVPAYNT